MDNLPDIQQEAGSRKETIKAEIVGEFRDISPSFSSSTETLALVALGLSIASWIILPLIGSVIALMIAPIAKKRIRESDNSDGMTLVKIAQGVAIANIIACAIVIYGIVALLRWVF